MSWLSRLFGREPAAPKKPRAYYDAAAPSRYRKFKGGNNVGPNLPPQRGAAAIRTIARDLQRNHDLTAGAIRVLVNNTVGPKGIGIEPQPRRRDGTIHEEYAAALREAWRDWTRFPEVTHRFGWARAQQLLAATWFRDGEAFAQILAGPVPLLNHATRVPLSVELFEPDMIPLDYSDPSQNILQGIQRNAWGQWNTVYVYKQHPGESTGFMANQNLKPIPASRILHVANLDRIGQIRGVSPFASVLNRLDDIKDYEESERIAAKVAAALTAYVKKGTPDLYDPAASVDPATGIPLPRDFALAPGTVIDTLAAGEDIGLVSSDRPNPNAVTWRQGQLKAVAAGLGASYSSISRSYDGNYSSQRQEMVEQWSHYAALAEEFADQMIAPVWQQFVETAHLSGVVRRPSDVAPERADDALYVGQQMPWIDPLKEADAWVTLVQAGFASEVEAIRRRGNNPRDVLEQIRSFRQAAAGLNFSTAVAPPKAAPATYPSDPTPPAP